MERACLDGDVDRLAVRDAGARAEPADHDRFVLILRDGGLHGALLADIARELAYVLGQRGRRCDREVGDDLGAQRLTEHDNAAQSLILRRVGLESRVLEVLRPDADDEPLTHVLLEPGSVRDELVAERELVLADLHGEAAVLARDAPLDEVHRGRADEAADEEVHGMLVELLRRRDLLQLALAHDGDPVTHRHRLDLVVRDVDRRHAELVLQARDLGAHVHAELRVEVRKRLVHEKRLRLTHDRPAHRDPLPLTAGERAGLSVEELREPEDVRRLADTMVDLVLRRLSEPEAERDVLEHGQVGIQRVALEHHRDVAVPGRHVVDDALADPQYPLR